MLLKSSKAKQPVNLSKYSKYTGSIGNFQLFIQSFVHYLFFFYNNILRDLRHNYVLEFQIRFISSPRVTFLSSQNRNFKREREKSKKENQIDL